MLKTFVRWALALALAFLPCGWDPEALAVELGDDDGRARADEFTGLTVGDNTLKLGILAFDYGITDRLSIGTDPPVWALRAVTKIWVPNLHLKWTLWHDPRNAVAALVGGYFSDISQDDAEGQVLIVPVSVFYSRGLTERFSAHGEANYNFVQAFGTGNVDNLEVGGAVVARTAQLGAMLAYRVTDRVVHVFVRGRVQVHATPITLESESQLDPFTRAEVGAELALENENPWMAVAGVNLIWERVVLRLGLGYGNFFVPGVNIVTPDRSIVPEGSFFVVF